MTVKVGLNGGAVLALVGVGVAAYVIYKGAKGLDDLKKSAGEAWQNVKETAQAASDAVSVRTDIPDADYGTPEAQAQAGAAMGEAGGENMLSYFWHRLTGATPAPSGSATWPSSGLSAAQANDARHLYAQQDPRRFDMQPEGSW